MADSISQAEREQILLKRNALLGLCVGGYFTLVFLYEQLSLTLASWQGGIFVLASLPLFAYLFYLFVSVAKGSLDPLTRAFILKGRCQDELNSHLHKKGMEWGYTATLTLLLLICISSELSLSFFNELSVGQAAKLLFGLGLAIYSVPVLLGLREAKLDE